MPEILTESFCERCGTRYTFESSAPKKTRRLGQFKTLSQGMKNWVMSDDSSMDEAMAAARSDQEREVTSQQLDAFHSTFNFCMNCRQYTCSNCWNEAEGRCLSCAPNLGQEILQAPFPTDTAFEPVRLDAGAWPEVDLPGIAADGNGVATNAAGFDASNGFHPEPSNGAGHEDDAAEFDLTARLASISASRVAPEPVAPVVAEPEQAAPAADADLEPAIAEAADTSMSDALEVEAAEAEAAAAIAQPAAAAPSAPITPGRPLPAVPPLPPTVEGRAEVGAARTSDLLARFRPGQNIDAELEAFEAELEATPDDEMALAEAGSVAPEAVVSAPEPVAAEPVALAPEPVAALAEPEPVAAVAEPEPEPVAAAAEPEPVAAEPEPEPIAAEAEPSRADLIEQPTWRIFAPDHAKPTEGQPAPLDRPMPGAPGPEPIQATAAPEWPARPEITDSPSMALLANHDRSTSDAMWAASAQEVLALPAAGPAAMPTSGVQPCSSCGLSLSATARFCRRCGTRQG